MTNAYVYFNLHKKVFSIRHKGLVIEHSKALHITLPTFQVSEAGRQRVISEKRKNVHAYAIAPIANIRQATEEKGTVDGWDAITYNPYRDSTFVKRSPDREAVRNAYEAMLWVDDNGKPHMGVKTSL